MHFRSFRSLFLLTTFCFRGGLFSFTYTCSMAFSNSTTVSPFPLYCSLIGSFSCPTRKSTYKTGVTEFVVTALSNWTGVANTRLVPCLKIIRPSQPCPFHPNSLVSENNWITSHSRLTDSQFAVPGFTRASVTQTLLVGDSQPPQLRILHSQILCHLRAVCIRGSHESPTRLM